MANVIHAFLFITYFATLFISAHTWVADYNKRLEQTLLRSYNRKHRPVKKESTTIQIHVYLIINHIEKVDEDEQTILLHGSLWATWTDEYLNWDPSKYNDTKIIAIESWKIWQPALSLYNSARGNSWQLHMEGLPATISYEGAIWASGTFSFHITCLFDFTRYPYDEQECPIVIADWIYDLSKVNLSDASGNSPLNKPIVKLQYDPQNDSKPKTYSAGWEVKDTWRKQCYWGPTGCKDEIPDGQPEWFWSLIEFGIKIKRKAPYFGITIILPTLVTSALTLIVFWIDTFSLAIPVSAINIILQELFGWELLKSLPPGNGNVPRIVSLYGFNLSLATIAFVLHVTILYLENVLPHNTKFPIKITNLLENFRRLRTFQLKGLSFDPQTLFASDCDSQLPNADASQVNQIAYGTQAQRTNALDHVECRDDHISHDLSIIEMNQTGAIMVNELESDRDNLSFVNDKSNFTIIQQQLYVLRRIMFLIFFIMYAITLPICLF